MVAYPEKSGRASALFLVLLGVFRACERDLLVFVSDGPISFNSERNGGKNAGKNYVFAFPHAL